ncbi:MAG: hypothetical protein AAGI34_16275 [Pseudomonadota bacterium]
MGTTPQRPLAKAEARQPVPDQRDVFWCGVVGGRGQRQMALIQTSGIGCPALEEH